MTTVALTVVQVADKLWIDPRHVVAVYRDAVSPMTVICLDTGRDMVISESVDDVVDALRQWGASMMDDLTEEYGR